MQNVDSFIQASDPGDHHVLTAAVTGNCDVISTFNQVSFPDSLVHSHENDCKLTDRFLTGLPGLMVSPVSN